MSTPPVASDSLGVFDVMFGATKEQTDLFRELLETETAYVEWLRVIVMYYMKPIQMGVGPGASPDGKPILAQSDMYGIFSNVESLLRLNDELLTKMKEQWERSKTQPGIELSVVFHDAFKDVLPYFKLYSVYINNYPTSVKTLKRCEAKNKHFAKFLAEVASMSEIMGGRRLGDLLIMPVQRLCKYPLFFRQILKKMHRDHVSYDTLQGTCLAVEKLAESVNMNKASAEGALRAYEVANNLTGLDVAAKELSGLVGTNGLSDAAYFQILAPGRTLIFECPCASVNVFSESDLGIGMSPKQRSKRKSIARTADTLTKGKKHVRYLFLFSDTFIVSKRSPSGDAYDYRMWLEVRHMSVCAAPWPPSLFLTLASTPIKLLSSSTLASTSRRRRALGWRCTAKKS